MLKIIREPNTEFLFAGLLEKEIQKTVTDLDYSILVEPRVGSDIFFAQDWKIESKEDAYGADFCFYTQPSQRESMTRIYGKKCALVTYAADPILHKPVPCEKEYDVGFIGSPTGDDRFEYLEALRTSNYKVFISSNIPGNELTHRLSRCKILFNHIRFVDVNLRFFENMALGCQVVNRKPELEEFAKEGVHYLGCSSPKEMIEVIDGLLHNPKQIEKITINSRTHFLSNHTYSHRVNAIINNLKENYVYP